jgi:FtsP/CotA-like multicopper oxidase with cupredoxin domain
MNRRAFLTSIGATVAAPVLSGQKQPETQRSQADFALHIGPIELEIAPGKRIKTTGYNGSVPGPILRMTEGKPATIDVYNETSIPELVHWHGLQIPSDVDGSAEEGTPMVPPRGHRQYQFVPRPAGTRWYHSHVYAGRDLHRSTYTGQFGFLLIDSGENGGRYDQEVLLALHGWNPYLDSMGGGDSSLDVVYNSFTVNSHFLGAGEPIRVKQGQRVLFRLLNANATKYHRLALPGHQFKVVALDGNPVAVPRSVPVLEMAPAERIDAIVEMNRPGIWVLGETDEHTRNAGLGVVVEYAGRTGQAVWEPAPPQVWDYTAFGRPNTAEDSAPQPDERVPLVFRSKWAGNRWVDHWTINGKEFPKTDPIRVRANRRYQLVFDNQSDESHPVHLHRHSFELVNVAGKRSAVVVKDVVTVPARKQVEVQFLADNPGPTLFHCHMQLHMDFGFMALLEYV